MKREVLLTALSTLTFPSALLGAAPGSVPSFIVGHALQTGGARYRVYCIQLHNSHINIA